MRHQVADARKLLTTWKQCYLDTRARIESSGRDARWEFDRKRIFDRTEYMAGICQNLYNVAQVSPMLLLLLLLSLFITFAALTARVLGRGNEFTAGLGFSLACPLRPVWLINSDSSLQLSCPEESLGG